MQNNDEAVEEAKKKKKQLFKITAEDLTEGPLGLNMLYINSVIRGSR
jgi:hypothetical protein